MRTSRNAIVRERLEEGAREIGLLLIALSPLDALLTAGVSMVAFRALLLVPLGILLFALAVFSERSRQDA